MTSAILGIGTRVPRYCVDYQTSARFAELTSGIDSRRAKQVTALYRRTGIQNRGSVLLDARAKQDIVNEFYPPAASRSDRGPTTKCRNDRYSVEAPALAEAASRSALESCQTSADSITHLVTVSCTGFSAPGVDIELIDRLGLPKTTQRAQVGFMGCHGAINGLRVGDGLVSASVDAKVLICSVELCSLHYQYGQETDRIVTGALFADGAAAVVLSNDPQDTPIGTAAASGSFLVPDSRDAMTWQIGNNGYQMTLSPQVPDMIEEHLPVFLDRWLVGFGESIASIGGWAVHPGGMRILRAVETALDLDEDDLAVSRGVLADHGNMSSATMLFIIQRFQATQRPKPWLMLGFGPGLEIEVALIR